MSSSTAPSQSPSSGKSWSQVAGENVKAKLNKTGLIMRNDVQIKPVFGSIQKGYDRIVVTPTNFNNKHFKGFISESEADTISRAIGLHELNNHHGTSFYRNENDILFITYKLKRNMSLTEVEESLNKYFWFHKTSKAGNSDRISGQVVHPPMEDNSQDCTTFTESSSRAYDEAKEVKIVGCNYEISEDEIRAWLKLYGEVRSEIEEIATEDKEGERLFETGSYIVKIKLNRLIPHIIPVHGLMVKCTYSGVKTQCRNCYGYHPAKMTKERSQKKTNTCEKKTFDQYIAEFKENNPHFPVNMTTGMNQKEKLMTRTMPLISTYIMTTSWN